MMSFLTQLSHPGILLPTISEDFVKPSSTTTIYEKSDEQPVQGRQTTYLLEQEENTTPGASGTNGENNGLLSIQDYLTINSQTVITTSMLLIKLKIGSLYSDCENSNCSQDCSHANPSQGMAQWHLTESNDVRNCQNSNSSAQQDVLILSMFEQLSTQVTHCTTVNKALTTELDRYNRRVKDLKRKSKMLKTVFQDQMTVARLNGLKQNLFVQVQEKDCLMKPVSEHKMI
ncbi:hypothetical protein Tco_0732716 [Tanacetum coccineum]